MTDPQWFVQTLHNTRKLLKDTPRQIGGNYSSRRRSNEVLQSNGRLKIFLNKIKMPRCPHCLVHLEKRFYSLAIENLGLSPLHTLTRFGCGKS